MHVRVTREELEMLRSGESVLIVRTDRREGTVAIFDENWRRVGVGTLRRVGKLKIRAWKVEVDGKTVEPEKLGRGRSWTKRLEKATRHGKTCYVHRLEPVKVIGRGRSAKRVLNG